MSGEICGCEVVGGQKFMIHFLSFSLRFCEIMINEHSFLLLLFCFVSISIKSNTQRVSSQAKGKWDEVEKVRSERENWYESANFYYEKVSMASGTGNCLELLKEVKKN